MNHNEARLRAALQQAVSTLELVGAVGTYGILGRLRVYLEKELKATEPKQEQP